MATKSTTTYTHECDLCGEECEQAELSRAYGPHYSTSDGRGHTFAHQAEAGICPGCVKRPISDLLTFFEAEQAKRGGK